ncbi:MAG: flagellar FliJ family protein [Nitrospirae bacterium]|jgi:flagellar export protein FliJ|nr:flagellar FliJ family protein [Nitrospirota bacterium]
MKLGLLRRYRAQVEEIVRVDLFRLRQELHELEARARLLEERMRRTTDEYSGKAAGGLALDEFLVWQSRLAADTSKSVAARQMEEQLRGAWDQKQGELREAMQDRRTLDRLAERIGQRRRLVQNRVDQMEMDEAARRTTMM